jgi:hypothetical protein
VRRLFLFGVLALWAPAARAEPVPPGSYVTLSVPVGGTASLDAGFASGILCDNVVILRAQLRGETPTSNRFYVTGVRPGQTLCRVGTARGSPSFLVQVTVWP